MRTLYEKEMCVGKCKDKLQTKSGYVLRTKSILWLLGDHCVWGKEMVWGGRLYVRSVARMGDFFHFGQLFKAFGNN